LIRGRGYRGWGYKIYDEKPMFLTVLEKV